MYKYFITRYRNKVCWHLFFFPCAVVAVCCMWNGFGLLCDTVLLKNKQKKESKNNTHTQNPHKIVEVLSPLSLQRINLLLLTVKFLTLYFSLEPVHPRLRFPALGVRGISRWWAQHPGGLGSCLAGSSSSFLILSTSNAMRFNIGSS